MKGEKMYDYRENMKADINEQIIEFCNYGGLELSEELADRQEFEEKLYDVFWVADSVTGNASGSYFCNSYKAKECVIDNFDLLKDMASEFGEVEEVGNRIMNEEWELLDVSIRCYLLGECLAEVLDELESEVA